MRPVARMLLFCAGIAQLCGCSGAALLNFATPHTGYTLHKDISYGDQPRQKLDVYVPDVADASRAVVLFFYGGSWKNGSKHLYRFVGQQLASQGYVTVIADYRLYPEVYFPAFVQDSALATQWVKQHITLYGGDAGKLFLAGHSAGGYNAVMLTLDKTYLNAVGGDTSWIRGTIGLAAPYDFLPFTDPDIATIFSKEKDELTQPIHYVRSGLPPILLLTGDDDDDVGMGNTTRLAEKLREYDNSVTERVYPDVGHIGIVLAMASGFEEKAPTLQDMLHFIRTYSE